MTLPLRIAIWIGGMALLAATAVDTLAVIGRHVAMPLTGSIEVIQAAVLLSGVIAMLVATVQNVHARVRLVIDRLPAGKRRVADRLSDLLTLAFFAALLVGSGWIAWDLRSAAEESELLGIPWMALRMIAAVILLVTCGVLAWQVLRGSAAPSARGGHKTGRDD